MRMPTENLWLSYETTTCQRGCAFPRSGNFGWCIRMCRNWVPFHEHLTLSLTWASRFIPEGRSDPIGLQSNTTFSEWRHCLTHVISGDEFDSNPRWSEDIPISLVSFMRMIYYIIISNVFALPLKVESLIPVTLYNAIILYYCLLVFIFISLVSHENMTASKFKHKTLMPSMTFVSYARRFRCMNNNTVYHFFSWDDTYQIGELCKRI
jgi:hypothetical protein